MLVRRDVRESCCSGVVRCASSSLRKGLPDAEALVDLAWGHTRPSVFVYWFLAAVPIGVKHAEADQDQLHEAYEDVDDPGAPACPANADHHVDCEEPGVLRVAGQYRIADGIGLEEAYRYLEN